VPLGALIVTGLGLSLRRGLPAAGGRGGAHHNVEWLGALLLGLGLGLAVVALYPDDPGSRAVNANAIPLGAAALLLLVAFAWRQSRRLNPLVRRALGVRPGFGGSLLTNPLSGGQPLAA